MNTIQLVIFDMDGLMFETGRLAYRAYLKSAEEHDFELIHDVYYYLTGKREAEIRQGMKELYGDVPVDQWRDSMNRYKEAILAEEKRVYKKPGLLDLLKELKQHTCQIALASSSSREKIATYFELEKMPSTFDIIVAGDQVKQGKPDPEIFLTACCQAKVLPKDALVLEDSFAGIAAAEKAGISAFMVEDDLTDLPTRKGRYPLSKQPIIDKEALFQGVRRFTDLTEVKDFLLANQLLG
ncbi:HAD family hydrolase [Enterococcus gallinarum]|uniref:HAD family hydrolase n=1 Tax=Enterococcus gallinarum TaxID=1353 RepID=UPI003D6B3DC6